MVSASACHSPMLLFFLNQVPYLTTCAVFLWRNMGGALLTLLPAVTYSLKASCMLQSMLQVCNKLQAAAGMEMPWRKGPVAAHMHLASVVPTTLTAS